MGLDYWNAEKVVNFRDVGEFVNLIAGAELLPTGRLLRGGTLRHVDSLSVVASPKTVFNLQKGADPEFPEVVNYHFPISNDYEKYHTETALDGIAPLEDCFPRVDLLKVKQVLVGLRREG